MTHYKPGTIAAQAAGATSRSGGVVGPIELSTTYVRDEAYRLPESGDIYRRDTNETVREAEHVVAALEVAAEARLFASGMAAIATLMRAAPGPVAVQTGTYYGTSVFQRDLADTGRRVVSFDPHDNASIDAALAERPALIHIETPSNPFLSVVDIAAMADRAHAAGAVLSVDSTAATPILTNPLTLGADIVVHSATKALNGHSDVLAGAAAVSDPTLSIWTRLKEIRAHEGAVISPFEAFLLVRGMRTVHLRVAEMCRSAMHVATWLAQQPQVKCVRYPGLATHPGHDVATVQMRGGFGGLMSFDVADAPAALALMSRLDIIKPATSLGGVESLIEHRHSVEPTFTGMPAGLLRLSVGIEAVEDLVADLSAALSATPTAHTG